MPTSSVLDENGLVYLWSKAKATFAGKNEIPNIEVATQSANGLMSSTDKTKLDGLQNYTNATQSSNGLMSAEDKTKVDGIPDTGIPSKVSDLTNDSGFATADEISAAIDLSLTNIYKYIGSVANVNALPMSTDPNLKNGHVYNVEDTGMNYAWNGSQWDSLGPHAISFNAITNARIDEITT